MFQYAKMCLAHANCTFKSTAHQLWKRIAVSKTIWNLSDASPTYIRWKVFTFFFIITFNRDSKISIDCVWCLLKDPLAKLKCQIYKHGCKHNGVNAFQIIFHLAHTWNKRVVSEFSEILLHKWYFCKLHMIKWKRHNGISVADTAEILIPLSCSKTSICKRCYQASHPYNDVKKETHFYDRQLNTVGMGQDSMISNADAMEILQSCT